MKSLEYCNTLMKPWATVEDIMILGRCSKQKAKIVMNEIEEEVKKENKKLPNLKTRRVHMPKVIKYFDIDVNHIMKMAEKQKELVM